MIKIEAFDPKHLENFTPRGINPPHVKESIKNNPSTEVSFIAGDTILAIIGTVRLYEGVCEAWTVTADEDTLRPHMKEYIRLLRAGLDNYFKKTGIKRLQITVPDTFPTAKKWGKALGFELEGVLRNYGWDNQNYYMFARYE